MHLSDLRLLFHSTGITYSQSNFGCGPVCLLTELDCFCESSNSVNNIIALTWSLIDSNMQQVGLPAGFIRGPHAVGTTATFADGLFIANVTNLTQASIASVANGIVNQNTDGYFLRCDDIGGVIGDAEITIPGKLLLQTNTS